MVYTDIIIDNKSEYMDSFFTYRSPDDIEVGDKVSVTLGRRRKPVDGYVAAIRSEAGIDESKIKDIVSVDKRRSLSPEMMDTALWMKKRYGVKYIDAVKMFTVAGKKEPAAAELAPADAQDTVNELTDEQRNAADLISAAIKDETGGTFLIKGVTNSGKTEVYMNAARTALDAGKSVIMLVPEIALSTQIAEVFRSRFGPDSVAVMHSKLKTSERLENWLRIRDGKARIVVGARTAVFAPLTDIGLIVIDEEHESTYKSDHNPKYETVDVAYKRAAAYKAALVLGSATPSIVSYSRAKEGLYRLIEMNSRIGESRMPVPEIVDMREETRRGNTGPVSERLRTAIAECHAEGKQTILFLNRRGYSTQIMCAECGSRMECPDCGIALTYHKSDNAAVCHYCGRKFRVPDACPSCGSKYLKFTGSGTEKIEEIVSKEFPDLTVDRFDLDTAKSQSHINKVIKDFKTGKTDILIGTQILAKGLDFRNVGLVGVVLADVSLNIPDYRASERTFQLITQVAGRAGRDSGESRVIIQTYSPSDDAIVSASRSDYEGYYEGELLHRNIMNYPPYSDIIIVSFVDKKDTKEGGSTTLAEASAFRDYLASLKDLPEGTMIYPPREEQRKMGLTKNKVNIMIKAPKGSRAGFVQAYMDKRAAMIAEGANCHIEIDVNPY